MRKTSLYGVLSHTTGEPRHRLRQMGFSLIRIVRIRLREERNPRCQRKEDQSKNS
jgi:hypothetical protein